jgi:hypothetical protein
VQNFHGDVAETQTSRAQINLVPIQGTVWIRREGTNAAVPCSSIQELSPGSRVEVPMGARAHVHYADGSLLLLAPDTRLQVLNADAPRSSGVAADSAALEHGQLFAWIAKQSSGRFSIRTPQGRVSVLGTEFDLMQRDANALRLIVAGGKVSFASVGAGPSGTFTLGAGEMLSVASPSTSAAGSNGVQRRTLSGRELRQSVAWARGTTPDVLSGRSTFTRGVAAIAVVLLGVVGYFGYNQYSRNGDGGRRPQGTDLRSVLGSTATIPGGTEMTANVEVELKKGAAWVPAHKIQASYKILESRPDGAKVFESALRSATSTGDNTSNLGDMSRLYGKPVRFTISPSGTIEDIRLPDVGAPDPRAAVSFVEMIRHVWMMSAASQITSSTQAGQEWAQQSKGPIPGYGDTSYEFQSTMRYDGSKSQGASTLQSFNYKGSGKLAGFKLREDIRGGRGTKLTLAKNSEETGQFERDPVTHITHGEILEHRTTTVFQTTTAPNTQPFTRPLPALSEDARLKITSGVAQ